VGGRLTEADVRLFVTLALRRRLVTASSSATCVASPTIPRSAPIRLASSPCPVCKTVSIDHIKHGCYSIKALNPTGIVPVGPELSTLLAV
jgi:putative glutathione S-transferase